MAEDQDLEQFDGECRLFPLPGVVLFPHAILPLHIFEPRYRQMMEDALRTDKLITVVQIKSPAPSSAMIGVLPEPEIEEIACIGKIVEYDRLPDGRFNLLLQGLNRVRLVREVSRDRLYRVAEAELIEEVDEELIGSDRKRTLVQLFRNLLLLQSPEGGDWIADLERNSLSAVTDLIAHALTLPPGLKQTFLGDPIALRRAEMLIHLLSQIERPRRPGCTYPPKFSDN